MGGTGVVDRFLVVYNLVVALRGDAARGRLARREWQLRPLFFIGSGSSSAAKLSRSSFSSTPRR